MTQKFSKLFSILALLSLTALFTISCSNEDTTGSGSGGGNPTEDISGFPTQTTQLASIGTTKTTYMCTDQTKVSSEGNEGFIATPFPSGSQNAIYLTSSTFTDALDQTTTDIKVADEANRVFKVRFDSSAVYDEQSFLYTMTFNADFSSAEVEWTYYASYQGESGYFKFKGTFVKQTT